MNENWKPRRWCGGWGYVIKTADQTVWDVPTVRVECRGCVACRARAVKFIQECMALDAASPPEHDNYEVSPW